MTRQLTEHDCLVTLALSWAYIYLLTLLIHTFVPTRLSSESLRVSATQSVRKSFWMIELFSVLLFQVNFLKINPSSIYLWPAKFPAH